MAQAVARTKVGRNEPCPCGSGQKYKTCCEGKRGTFSRAGWIALVAVMVVSVLGLVVSLTRNDTAGPRQVWSPEHGHYHTLP